jgi:hypothetical protein
LSGVVQQIVEGHDFPPMIEARALIKSLEGSTVALEPDCGSDITPSVRLFPADR